jgi:uncharacterized protein YjaZ
MKKQLIITLFFISTFRIYASKIYTSDITNFWIAYDSIQTTNSHSQKVKYISDLYIKKATNGLQDFIAAREFSANEWVNLIEAYPKYWKSVRLQTLSILNDVGFLENLSKRFKEIYPDFIEPEIYFTIGCLRSGGTTTTGRILIGAEIGAANETTESSELSEWLKNLFKTNNGIVQLVAHEMNHTQQIESPDSLNTLLNQIIKEGSCDFIAELLINKQYTAPHTNYGLIHKKSLLKEFYNHKDQIAFDNWLYNGNESQKKPADLGYYIGYEICKTYYENAINKSGAIKEIVQLDWLDKNKLLTMLNLTMKKNGL